MTEVRRGGLCYWKVADETVWTCAGCGRVIQVGRAALITEDISGDGFNVEDFHFQKAQCEECAYPKTP